MNADQVRERGLERIARGDWDNVPDRYQAVKEYASWLLRQTGNQDEPTPPNRKPSPELEWSGPTGDEPG